MKKTAFCPEKRQNTAILSPARGKKREIHRLGILRHAIKNAPGTTPRAHERLILYRAVSFVLVPVPVHPAQQSLLQSVQKRCGVVAVFHPEKLARHVAQVDTQQLLKYHNHTL